jgi:hypothetical protein
MQPQQFIPAIILKHFWAKWKFISIFATAVLVSKRPAGRME